MPRLADGVPGSSFGYPSAILPDTPFVEIGRGFIQV